MARDARGHGRGRDETVLRLWPNPGSVAQARHAVEDFCRSHDLTSLSDDARLLTSELVTNACRATSGVITIVLLQDTTGIVVTVTDDDPSPLTVPVGCPSGDATAGRGLYLVDKISSDWGTTHHDTHAKTVWFRLDSPAHPSAPVAP